MTRAASGRSPQRVRMVDVARAAGVSQPTASRVLSGDLRVTRESREAVLAAASEMGYVVNRAASSLAGNRTNSVGFVIAEPGSHLWGNPYFPRLMAGITAELNARRQQLVLFMPQSRVEERQLVDYLLAGHVDGVLMTTSRNRDPLLRALLDAHVPVVVGGRPIGIRGASFVDVDNERAAYEATLHLLDSGYRHVATIAGPPQTAAGKDRLVGYRRAITEREGKHAELREMVAIDFSQPAGEAAAADILMRWPDTDAIFAAADLLCFGALITLKLQGLAVPSRIGLVSFDDSEPNALSHPPLTSVSQPVERLGTTMVQMLFEQMAGDGQPRDEVLDTSLVIRESSTGPGA